MSAALLPAILLWLYIWKKDTQKEPTSLLVKAVLLGVAIIIPVAILESGIEAIIFGVEGKPTSLLGTTTMAFVVAALPEENRRLPHMYFFASPSAWNIRCSSNEWNCESRN